MRVLVSLGVVVTLHGLTETQPALTAAEVKRRGYRDATLVYDTPKLRIASRPHSGSSRSA